MYILVDKNFCDDCSMAKFGVNVVVLVDNMSLVFFLFFSKTFQKKFLHSLYYEKKIRTKLPTKKKNSCRGNFSAPLPGYLMVYPLAAFFTMNSSICFLLEVIIYP